MEASVLIPNYRHAPCLKELPGSVLHTFRDFGVAILHDCSPDASREASESVRSHPQVTQNVCNRRILPGRLLALFARELRGKGAEALKEEAAAAVRGESPFRIRCGALQGSGWRKFCAFILYKYENLAYPVDL